MRGEIKYSEPKYRSELAALWKCCFSDSDEFIQFYFEKVYQDSETIIYLEEGKPVASLQMIPYRLRIFLKYIPSIYIYGVMTHPDYRKRGYMNELMSFGFQEMQKKGIGFSFLIPQRTELIEVYKKQGYEMAFPTNSTRIALKEGESSMRVYSKWAEIENVDKLYLKYTTCLFRYGTCILKTQSQFEAFVSDFFIGGGSIFESEDDLAFVFVKDKEVVIEEMFPKFGYKRGSILAAIASVYQKKTAILKASAQNSYLHRKFKALPEVDENGKIIIKRENSVTGKMNYAGMIKQINKTIPLPNDIYMSMMLN